ncbi:hypothetical protein OG426_28230 [Streptomyces canus]|nr:hypothetical protein [Streptomyces canus]MCX4858656.1 hypothetical protein [Streptomyces canus]WSW36063.1 hypothetical protein OG426_28230 [Streptomyces canus]
MSFVRTGVVGALVVAGLGSGVAFADDAAQSDGLEIQAPVRAGGRRRAR